MKKNKDNLVDKCCDLYQMSLPVFCKEFNQSESTLKGWRTNLPLYGKLLLEQMMENYHLKKELETKAKKLSKLQSLINDN